MAQNSYFRPADLSTLLTLEQQFALVLRRFSQQLLLSGGGLVAGALLLTQLPGLLVAGGVLTGLSLALGLRSVLRYHAERECLWQQVQQVAEPAASRRL
ncbi:hypothetical protein KLP40_08120 [Hymenobacter sp. NST-14]|uniref:hypothetical protein n=1 Tax=Hymenobacter piscis TaxID=2839984 RepID=UPI001C03A1E5|nr:hypothetical protein [Hymenobacter piscis]MBT9393127.1 hypothetical protein [Hymenobacter piscis]